MAATTFVATAAGVIPANAQFQAESEADHASATSVRNVPYPFRSAAELLSTAASHNLTIAELLLANEVALLTDFAVKINRPGAANGTSATNRAASMAEEASAPEDQVRASILALWEV